MDAQSTPNSDQTNVDREQFRNYVDSERQRTVQKFYTEQHAKQTVAWNEEVRKNFLVFDDRAPGAVVMDVWSMLQHLDKVTDESDPDTELSQFAHAIQTAESLRARFPGPENEWLVLTGLIHDLGKVLNVIRKGELGPLDQWSVVGDIFPVGCQYSDRIVFPETFAANPDIDHPVYSTPLGVYKEHCGFLNVDFAFGHDEYLFKVLEANLPRMKNPAKAFPEEALYVVRHHSFYPWHQEGAYEHLANDHDREMLPWLKKFQQHDLYSKSDQKPELNSATVDFYKNLVHEYFPDPLVW